MHGIGPLEAGQKRLFGVAAGFATPMPVGLFFAAGRLGRSGPFHTSTRELNLKSNI